MKEERIPLILFLVSILIMVGVVALFWPYLVFLLEIIGIALFALFIAIIIVGVAVVIANIILIPVFAARNPSTVREADYSIDDAVDPGKDARAEKKL